MRWSTNHVKEWIDWSIGEHSLHDVIDVEKFPGLNGRELCHMSLEEFAKLVGQYEAADKLLQHIHYLREGNIILYPYHCVIRRSYLIVLSIVRRLSGWY